MRQRRGISHDHLSGYGYGTVPGGRWAMNTEGGQSRGRLFIPHPARCSGYLFMITLLNIIGINIGDLFVFLAFDWNGW